MTTDPTNNSDAKELPLRTVIAANVRQLVLDLIPPVRVIATVFVATVVFLVFDQVLFLIFDKLSTGIKTRIIFVQWILDGVQVLSIVAVSAYFVFSTLAYLPKHWRYAERIERKAGFDENQ